MHIAMPIQTQKIDIIQSYSNFPSVFTPKNTYPRKIFLLLKAQRQGNAQMKNSYHVLKSIQLCDFFKNYES